MHPGKFPRRTPDERRCCPNVASHLSDDCRTLAEGPTFSECWPIWSMCRPALGRYFWPVLSKQCPSSILFGPCWPTAGQSWENMAIFGKCGQHMVNIGQCWTNSVNFWAELGPTWPQRSPIWPVFAELGPNLCCKGNCRTPLFPRTHRPTDRSTDNSEESLVAKAALESDGLPRQGTMALSCSCSSTPKLQHETALQALATQGKTLAQSSQVGQFRQSVAKIWPKATNDDRSWRTCGPNPTMFGPCGTHVDQARPNLAAACNIWAKVWLTGKVVARIGQDCLNLASCWPIWANMAPQMAQIGQKWPRLGRAKATGCNCSAIFTFPARLPPPSEHRLCVCVSTLQHVFVPKFHTDRRDPESGGRLRHRWAKM